MRTTRQLSITLPNEMADAVTAMVEAGKYASESEVIRDGVRTLWARDQAMENWLRTDVAAAYDAMIANPNDYITPEELRAHIANLKVEKS
jgi:antitoxin ParD1/3/4